MPEVYTGPVTFVPRPSAIPATPVQPRPVVHRQPAMAAEPIEAAPRQRATMEDVLSVVFACITAAVIVATTAGIAHVIFSELLQYNSQDLIRGFSGI